MTDKNPDDLAVREWRWKYGYWADEHPDHPMSDWRSEVINNDTRQGYWEWATQRDEED